MISAPLGGAYRWLGKQVVATKNLQRWGWDIAPWPDASPLDDHVPVVMNVPVTDWLEFGYFRGAMYGYRALSEQPRALAAARSEQRIRWRDDFEFGRLFSDTLFSTYLRALAPKEHAIFKIFLEDGGEYRVVNFQAMEELTETVDFFFAHTIALFRLEEGQRLTAIAIALPDTCNETLGPNDGFAWELAKVFVEQGAVYHTATLSHGQIHFPIDAIDGTVRAMVRGGPLRQALEPHSRFTLPLELSVLHSPMSALNRTWFVPFAGLAPSLETIKKFLRRGYVGIEGNPSYPPYRYRLGPTSNPFAYGRFLRRYYSVIEEFADEIARFVPRDGILESWADVTSECVEGFPDGTQIGSPDTLRSVIAMQIYTRSVEHNTDHYTFEHHRLYSGDAALSLRLRIPPPRGRNIPRVPDRDIVYDVDMWRGHMLRKCIFYPGPNPFDDNSLVTTPYEFVQPELRAAAARFRTALMEVDAALPEDERFIPLSELGRSTAW